MCDYSLESALSVKATQGQKVTSSKVGDSITRGFIQPGRPNVAVCMLPGTELKFEAPIRYTGLGNSVVGTKFDTARFRKINLETPHLHHDALELPDGTHVMVARLVEGQHATVLQVPAATAPSKPGAARTAETVARQPAIAPQRHLAHIGIGR